MVYLIEFERQNEQRTKGKTTFVCKENETVRALEMFKQKYSHYLKVISCEPKKLGPYKCPLVELLEGTREPANWPCPRQLVPV